MGLATFPSHADEDSINFRRTKANEICRFESLQLVSEDHMI